MLPSPIILEEIECSDGKIIIRDSNESSPIIKLVKESMDNPLKERFFDLLLSDYNALKLITNAYIDMKKTENGTPIFLFSSELEKTPNDEKKSLKEFSEQCKYRLNPEMRAVSTIIQPFRQMLASETIQTPPNEELQLMQEKKMEMIFHLNDFYGYSLETQINQGFSDRTQLLSLSDISHMDYEKIIRNIITIGVGSVLQHICWCKKHSIAPYAILIHGHNEIGDIKCPICNETLCKGRFVTLSPEFDSLLKYHGGFLPLLIAWYLTKEDIKWTADVTINGKEYGDIIFKDPMEGRLYLLECKVHGRDKKMRGYDKVIEKDIRQIISHVKFWEGKSVKIEKAHVLTNFIGDTAGYSSIRDKVVDNMKDEISSRRINVHPIKPIRKIISEIVG